MKPLFHLSFPVRDIEEAVNFYTRELGAVLGRQTEAFTDLFLFGVQITLQNDPQAAAASISDARHFGAVLSWEDWKDLAYRLKDTEFRMDGPRLERSFTPQEQAKIMLADPSGNLIELKTYKNPELAFGAILSA